MEKYKCTKCSVFKQKKDFLPGTNRSGLSSWCRQCTSDRVTRSMAVNKERWKKEDPRKFTKEKFCISCKQSLPSIEFGIRRNNLDGLYCRCKSCFSKFRKQKSSIATLTSTLRYIGLSKAEFDRIWQQQHGLCVLCSVELHRNSNRGCHIDHCHITGKFRGLLCGGCNNALGKLGDTPEALKRALDYVSQVCYTI